jgi:G3E family GTPase
MTIPLTVLTGFLGSGKTTVLNHLLRQPALADTVVIVNELGEIALDHLLIEHAEEKIALLRSGCVCCAVRGDLIETLRELAARRRSGDIGFRRVITETTGLADPAPILNTLMVDPGVVSEYRLEGVVATVDLVNGPATLDAHAEAVKQIGTADLILLTKADLARPDAAVSLDSRLRRINRLARVVPARGGRIDPAEIARLGPFDPSCKSADVRRWLSEAEEWEDRGARHSDAVRTLSVIIDAPVRWQDFSSWLELMAAMRGEQLLRLKGIVAVEEHPDRPIVIHGVQHIIHPVATLGGWPSADRRTRLVFITQAVSAELITQTLAKFAHVRSESIGVH